MTDRSERIDKAREAIRELIADWPGVMKPRATAYVLAKAAIDAYDPPGDGDD